MRQSCARMRAASWTFFKPSTSEAFAEANSLTAKHMETDRGGGPSWSPEILISGPYMRLELLPSLHNRVVSLPTAHQREASSLELTLRALQPNLSRSDVTGVCIN